MNHPTALVYNRKNTAKQKSTSDDIGLRRALSNQKIFLPKSAAPYRSTGSPLMNASFVLAVRSFDVAVDGDDAGHPPTPFVMWRSTRTTPPTGTGGQL